jgi:hypothetical protein
VLSETESLWTEEKFSIFTIKVMSMTQIYTLVCMLRMLVSAAIWNL